MTEAVLDGQESQMPHSELKTTLKDEKQSKNKKGNEKKKENKTNLKVWMCGFSFN